MMLHLRAESKFLTTAAKVLHKMTLTTSRTPPAALSHPVTPFCFRHASASRPLAPDVPLAGFLFPRMACTVYLPFSSSLQQLLLSQHSLKFLSIPSPPFTPSHPIFSTLVSTFIIFSIVNCIYLSIIYLSPVEY